MSDYKPARNHPWRQRGHLAARQAGMKAASLQATDQPSGTFPSSHANETCNAFTAWLMTSKEGQELRTLVKEANVEDNERPCTRCKGSGVVDDILHPGTNRVCSSCGGNKMFAKPDGSKILQAITTDRGAAPGKRKLLKSFPSKKLDHYRDRFAAECYYVWRLARFHGGEDMTMPVTADMVLRSHPWKPELDKMADDVAAVAFGTNMAAARRWGRALGHDV